MAELSLQDTAEIFSKALEVFDCGDYACYFSLDLPLERKELFLAELKTKVRKSYRRLISSGGVHPDKGGTEETFIAVKKAYDFIQAFELAKRRMVKCPHCHGLGHVIETVPVSSFCNLGRSTHLQGG